MAVIQFIRGVNENIVPVITLTRSRDGDTGTATFRFLNPRVLESSTTPQGIITGMYLIDEEGQIITRDVNVRFVNGKPQGIEAIYIMQTKESWDRFMRFMERYSQDKGLSFMPAGDLDI
nr:photosystem II protein W [Cryptomonas borealis]